MMVMSSTYRLGETGLARIAVAFATARAAGRAALMPYFTLGYPTPGLSLDVVEALARGGADLIELGIPFSDPLADGPTIQRSTQVALAQGMTVGRCLEMTAALRRRGLAVPLLLMGYVNPLLAYGVERFVRDAVAAGTDGFIVPDLPPDEAGELRSACALAGCALIHLLAPTTDRAHAHSVASQSSGFLYLVSLAGVTGARGALPANLAGFVQLARAATQMPVAVGFGISTPEQAQAVGQMADGVIVGSALVNAVESAADPAAAAETFVRSLRHGLEVGILAEPRA